MEQTTFANGSSAAGSLPINGIPTPESLAKRLGLRRLSRDRLSVRRRRRRDRWIYLDANRQVIRDPATIDRLDHLAVPPAYRDVRYASDPAAHLQAVGRDAAGRLQYRYHPAWQQVREYRKAGRLARLAQALPRIRRSLGQHLSSEQPTIGFTAAAVIELVALSAIRAGRESYARMYKTRGAATLLKSNVTISKSKIRLDFRSKGGKTVRKEFEAARLATALRRLQQLPGPRLFQYRTADGALRPIKAREVNAFLREIAGARISLKDFRTLLACERVLQALAHVEPASSQRQRRKQTLQAIRAVADELANTPAICRKSYVQDAVLEAFESGRLRRFSQTLKRSRSRTTHARMLMEVIDGAMA
jgi:DNA topoisomerase-1